MTIDYQKYIRRTLKSFFVGTAVSLLVLMLASWIVSIYVDGVNGLLSANGIRWMVAHISSNFSTLPFAQIILGLIGVSVLLESELLSAFRKHTSLKQKHALRITIVSGIVILCLFSCLLFLPDAVLLSCFGNIEDSPFTEGLYGLIVLFVVLVSNIYGFTSGKFVTLYDVFTAHAVYLRKTASSFIILFLASQFVECLDYTDILLYMGNEQTTLLVLKCCLYYIPILLLIFQENKS